jgi:hypothetical protein
MGQSSDLSVLDEFVPARMKISSVRRRSDYEKNEK